MRKIAVILLLIFTLVQAGQVCCSLFSDTTAFFIADEEKASEKKDIEKKTEKKDYLSFHTKAQGFARHTNIAFHQIENIKHHPCLEMQTPPPDFC